MGFLQRGIGLRSPNVLHHSHFRDFSTDWPQSSINLGRKKDGKVIHTIEANILKGFNGRCFPWPGKAADQNDPDVFHSTHPRHQIYPLLFLLSCEEVFFKLAKAESYPSPSKVITSSHFDNMLSNSSQGWPAILSMGSSIPQDGVFFSSTPSRSVFRRWCIPFHQFQN